MITVTPFEDEFCQKTHKMYAINNCTPNDFFGGSMTTSAECPYCKTRNIFRVYEPKKEYETDDFCVSIYDCKCPNCGKEFEIKDEFEKED
jgi:DNA-directed RNA polymerase subunit RPC12/RpoP